MKPISPFKSINLRKKGVYSSSFKVVKIRTESNGFGALKTLLIALMILLSLGTLLLIHYVASQLFYWYLGFSFIMTILTCIFILSSNKHGLSKAVWMLFVLLAFYFGYVIYFLADERIFFRKSRKKYDKIFNDSDKFIQKYRQPNASRTVQKDSEYLYRTGRFNTFTNCDLEYFSSGTKLFDDVIENLKQAEKFVFIEYFILAKGVLFNRIFDVLKEKAKSGVDVRVIYDDMGSNKHLPKKLKSTLTNAGIKIFAYNRLVPYFSVALNYRDHRKIVVIDGKIAYTGGCNLADEYINEKRIHGYWKDNGVRIKGGAVDSFTLMFLRQWSFVSNSFEDYTPYLNNYDAFTNESTVIPYADGLDYTHNIGKGIYENVIGASQEKLFIMTPYLVLDDTMSDLIKNRALAGVDVRIILPGIPDKKLVYSVSKNEAKKLAESGVKIYYMKDAFVHTKAVLTENCMITGSINMDLRSFYQQFECALYTDDKKLMADLENDFINTFDNCKVLHESHYKNKNLLIKLYTAVLQIFAPFM